MESVSGFNLNCNCLFYGIPLKCLPVWKTNKQTRKLDWFLCYCWESMLESTMMSKQILQSTVCFYIVFLQCVELETYGFQYCFFNYGWFYNICTLCMCMYVYVCVYMYVYVCMNICLCICMCMCVWMHMYVCMYVCV